MMLLVLRPDQHVIELGGAVVLLVLRPDQHVTELGSAVMLLVLRSDQHVTELGVSCSDAFSNKPISKCH